MPDDLHLTRGYSAQLGQEAPPEMGFRKMVQLALRAWPYIRPLLLHLILLLCLAGVGLSSAMIAVFVGTDVFTNKVLVGQKLQPLQGTLMLLGPEYVTTDPEQLGENELEEGKGATVQSEVSSEPQLTPEQRRTVRNRLIIWGIIGACFGALLGYGSYYYSIWIWQAVNQNLRVKMVARVETLSLKYHDEARVGDGVFRVYQDSAMIVNLIQGGIIEPIFNAGMLIWTILILGAFNPWLMVIGGFTMCVMIVVAGLTTPRIRLRALRNRLANSDLTARTQETFTAAKLVKANNSEERVLKRFVKDSKDALNAAYFLRVDMILMVLIVSSVAAVGVIASEFLMVSWVIEGERTLLGAIFASIVGYVIWNTGAFQSVILQVEGAAWGSRGLLDTWMRMQDLYIALERAYYLLEIDEAVVDPESPVPIPEPIERIVWRDIDFSYVPDKPIFTGLNLEAHRGTITAIVGSTGAGKSTAMSLLLRLFDVDKGTLEVNSTDIRALKIADLRANVAIALQKNVLFADTIANNIAFGTNNASREKIEEAATIATADEFISQLPKGLDTELGERGGKLSSGQRQRLSIARAVVRNTPVLILDEPTASLDAKTEERVLKNLSKWGENRLIFLITHRIATIKQADQIAFIEDGKVAELGTHDELIVTPNGRYRQMIEAEVGKVEI